ncbi:MAG: peptidoglycan bridge formation glycyltransferase FemA/FemB family protein [Bacteroidetes bacterium]|nr:peptidoglycan bridge formation glycyltransferase FemA/FemB family protein [Bacteroidota bacterium]
MVNTNFLKGEAALGVEKWNYFVKNSQHCTPFQTPEFFKIFNSIPGFTAEVFAVVKNDEIKSLCVVTFQKEKGIKGFFSRRAIIYGGPVFSEGSNQEATILLSRINQYLKGKVIYSEIRNLNDYTAFHPVFNGMGWKLEPHLNFLFNCNHESDIWGKFNNNRKRQINKAIKSGATIKIADKESEIISFYEILRNLYNTKIKKPLMPLDFFLNFFKSPSCKFLLVVFEEKVIGGIMCPIIEGKFIYEWYICGLDDAYKDLSPSVMATFAAIDYGKKHSYQMFDFMGAGKPNEDYGVRDFKSKFGGELVNHGRYLIILNKPLYKLGISALNVLKKLKK